MTSDPLDTQRSASLGRLIARAHLRISSDLAKRSEIDRDLSPAQKSALVQLEVSGSRVTTLAKRLGVSKQAASKLVLDLEAKGLVHRTADPDDRRSAVIHFTPRGRTIVQDTVAYFDEIESRIAEEVGAAALSRLKTDMRTVADLLDPDGF